MLLNVSAIALIALAGQPAGKQPPAQKELVAIAERGRDLAGYDFAAWHDSHAVQAENPKEGSVVRYIARKSDKGWVVAFGRLDEAQEKFLIAYEATHGDKPDVFDVKGKKIVSKRRDDDSQDRLTDLPDDPRPATIRGNYERITPISSLRSVSEIVPSQGGDPGLLAARTASGDDRPTPSGRIIGRNCNPICDPTGIS